MLVNKIVLRIKKVRLFFLLIILISFINQCNGDFQNSTKERKRGELPEQIQKLKNLTVYQGETQPIDTIHFVRDVSYNGTNHFAVDTAGRVYTYIGRGIIKVYKPDGNLLTKMGGKGAGPGEFRTNFLLQPRIHLNRLFAYDNILQRINVYSLKTLRSSNTILMSPDHWDSIEKLRGYRPDPQRYFILNNGKSLMEFQEPLPLDQLSKRRSGYKIDKRKARYYLMDMQGDILPDQIIELSETVLNAGIFMDAPNGIVPFVRNSLITVSDNGHIYTGWSGNFLIKVYNSKGKYLRAIYYTVENARLNRSALIDSVSKQLQLSLQNIKFPPTWPVLHSILVDDKQQLWVSTITAKKSVYQWWVLDVSDTSKHYGRLLAKFTWPGNRQVPTDPQGIKVVKDGNLYSYEKDKKSSEGKIIRYRVVMAPFKKPN